MPVLVPLKYRAFLSYAHADMRWGKRVHGALEGFRIDKDLVDLATPMGPVPRSLRPIFRDREDFSGGHTLGDATVAALDQSAALVVLCSSVAATRPAVNEEVRLFRWRHPERPVIPVIVNAAFPECYPPALRFDIETDGTVSDRPVTILGPDLQEAGDGPDLGLAKLVAGLVGVPADDIFRRAQRAHRRSVKVRNGVIGVLALLVVTAGTSAHLFREELKRNEALLKATLKTATEIVNTAVAQAKKYNLPRTATLEMLTRAEALFDHMARLGRPTPELQREKAWMLIEFARNYEILGDTAKQRARADEAAQIMSTLASGRPDNLVAKRDHSIALDERGDVLRQQGNLPAALDAYKASLAIIESLVAAASNDADFLIQLSRSQEKIGTVLRDQGNLVGALDAYKSSLFTSERLANAYPNSIDRQRDASVANERLGSIYVAQGNLIDALREFRASIDRMTPILDRHPSDTELQRFLSISQEKVGDVLRELGNRDAALDAYKAAFALVERLARSDLTNAKWQRDFSIAQNKIGDVLYDFGNLTAALEAYQASLIIAEHLAKSDTANAQLQRDLSVSQEKIGDVLRAQGNLAAALDAYTSSLAVREHLANADPSNTDWKYGVALSLSRLGLVAAKQGDRDGANAHYERGREIMQRLVVLAPNHAAFKRTLAWFDARFTEQ